MHYFYWDVKGYVQDTIKQVEENNQHTILVIKDVLNVVYI
jgi:hypothetical protein